MNTHQTEAHAAGAADAGFEGHVELVSVDDTQDAAELRTFQPPLATGFAKMNRPMNDAGIADDLEAAERALPMQPLETAFFVVTIDLAGARPGLVPAWCRFPPPTGRP